MRALRILHVVPTYLPATRYGGPIYSVHSLCRALVELGHDVHVYTTSVDGDEDSNVPHGRPVLVDGVSVSYFNSKIMRRLYWAPQMLGAMQQHLSAFQMLHTHSVYLWPTAAAAHLARKKGIPYVVSPRGMLVKELIKRKATFVKSAWIRLVERDNLERAAAVHVTSQREAADLEEFNFSIKKIICIPNGVDSPGKVPSGAYGAKTVEMGYNLPNRVVFLGRISWKKGIEPLIRAMPLMPGVELVIAGNDEEGLIKQLQVVSNQLCVQERVRFVGSVIDAEKWRLLESAACLVLPSLSENFGNVVLEAMSVGCPVVVTPGVGAAEIVERVGAGLVVRGEPEQLASAVNLILREPTLAHRFGRAGIEAVAREFEWSSVATRMEMEYESILAAK